MQRSYSKSNCWFEKEISCTILYCDCTRIQYHKDLSLLQKWNYQTSGNLWQENKREGKETNSRYPKMWTMWNLFESGS